jgi:hypothetical protein
MYWFIWFLNTINYSYIPYKKIKDSPSYYMVDEVTQLTYVQPRFLHRAGGLRSPECRHKEDVRSNSSVLVTGNLAIEHGHW